MSYDNLLNHYKTNFQLMQHHNYSLYDLEHMMPYERDVYLNLLLAWLEEERKKIEQQQQR